ncbi:Rpp25p [Perkinsus chesapeaki]|uniref:Rpp25p n=1 Tax=Perkinsus chesapeaki TaxID=330153 RepID=A0A7J6LBG8_PERCH|nr:Rpp25p [Perkinsus chesapeaki]
MAAATEVKYKRVAKPADENKKPAANNEIRITSIGRVNNFVDEGISIFTGSDGKTQSNTVKVLARELAAGASLSKAVIVSEILTRRVPGIKKKVDLGSNDVEEEFEPVNADSQADHISRARIVPSLEVTLTVSKPVTSESIKADSFVERPNLVGDSPRRGGGRRPRGRRPGSGAAKGAGNKDDTAEKKAD